MSKPREFFVYEGKLKCSPLLFAYKEKQNIKREAPENFDEFHVIEKSAADRLAAALSFCLHCTEQIGWIKEGPGAINNPMFLGTLTVEGDQKVHEEYLSAKETLKNYLGDR